MFDDLLILSVMGVLKRFNEQILLLSKGEASNAATTTPTSAAPETASVTRVGGGGGWGKLKGNSQTSTPTQPATENNTTSGGGGSGWGKLKGNSQPPTPLQSAPESTVGAGGGWGKLKGNQEVGDATKKSKLGAQAKVEGKSGSAARRSFDQNDAILGQSFAEFKTDIKKEVAEVHSKISNMEDLLKNILHNMEK